MKEETIFGAKIVLNRETGEMQVETLRGDRTEYEDVDRVIVDDQPVPVSFDVDDVMLTIQFGSDMPVKIEDHEGERRAEITEK